jgi:peptidoglycan hydrolase-like protein with peptidoglycan-binding domain
MATTFAPRHPHWRNDPAVLSAARNTPPFKLGANNSGVQRLREALSLMGAPASSEALAQFGPATQALVRSFQTLYNLAVDGEAGAGTVGKLDELLANPAARRPWLAATPAAPAVPASQEAFLQQVFVACAADVKAAGLPVSAMLACAAVESGWGKGSIYRDTGNLFSLQKWPWVTYPLTTHTLWRETVIQTSPRKTARAPFNTARDMTDAGQQWCQWIKYYGSMQGPPGSPDKARPQAADNKFALGQKLRLMAMVHDPLAFARNLYLVGFGESTAHGELYARVLRDNNLLRFDA